MTPLDWQDVPSAEEEQSTAGVVDPWFGLSLALLGVIIGFVVGNVF